MKLNDFVKKPNTPRKASPQFVLQNDAELLRYQEEVADLNNQLGHYRRIEAERDDAIRKFTTAKESASESQLITDNLNEEVASLKQTIEYQNTQLEKISVLEEEVRNVTGRYSATNNDLQNITKTAFHQSKTLSDLGKQLEALIADNKQITEETIQARADKMSMLSEYETMKTENTQMQNFTDNTSKINKKVQEEVKEIRDRVSFYENECREVTIQLEQSVAVEEKLRHWLTDLESQKSETVSAKGKLNLEVQTLQGTVMEMGTVIEDLMKEMTYLRAMNKEYRKELSKPRFMSMGAIARKEGFVMPNGKENLRKHYLGNSAPTLLKFKAREDKSYAR